MRGRRPKRDPAAARRATARFGAAEPLYALLETHGDNCVYHMRVRVYSKKLSTPGIPAFQSPLGKPNLK
jgi:hypothetical protein